jgi:hypothetical protein
MKHIVWIFLIALTYLSCKPNLKQKITGFYSIDEIRYKQRNIINDLGVNVISFDENGICRLPPMRMISTIKSEKEQGSWRVNERDTTLKIIAHHKVFNGVFKVSFTKDYEAKLLKIILNGDSTYLIASKGLIDFETNKEDW